MKTTSLTGLTGLLLLAGCAYNYVPTQGAATAKIRVADKLTLTSLTDHAGCPKTVLKQAQAENVIPANTRLWIEPLNIVGNRSCSVTVSFVADAGKDYVLLYQDQGAICTANVLERDHNGKLTQNLSVINEPFEQCMY